MGLILLFLLSLVPKKAKIMIATSAWFESRPLDCIRGKWPHFLLVLYAVVSIPDCLTPVCAQLTG